MAGSTQLADAVTWENVQDVLSGTWHVLHFIGHGDYDRRTDQGVIALVATTAAPTSSKDSRGPTQRGAADTLAGGIEFMSVREAARRICSRHRGTLVRRGINAVAAMQFSISDGP
jgi:hypothetical protein